MQEELGIRNLVTIKDRRLKIPEGYVLEEIVLNIILEANFETIMQSYLVHSSISPLLETPYVLILLYEKFLASKDNYKSVINSFNDLIQVYNQYYLTPQCLLYNSNKVCLNWAIQENNLNIVREAVEKKTPNFQFKLLRAAQYNSIEVLNYLFDRQMDILEMRPFGQFKVPKNVSKEVIEARTKIITNQITRELDSILSIALEKSQDDNLEQEDSLVLLKFYLDKHLIVFGEYPGQDTIDEIMYEAGYNKPIMYILLDYGLVAAEQLFWYTLSGNYEIALDLLDNGKVDIDSSNIMVEVVRSKNYDLLEQLLDRDYDLNEFIDYAIGNDDFDMVKYLIEHVSFIWNNERIEDFIDLAIEIGNDDIIEYLKDL